MSYLNPNLQYKIMATYVWIMKYLAAPHSSVCSVADLRTGGRWFDPRLGQYSFRRLVIVIVVGFIFLPKLSVVSIMWESRQWLEKNIVQCTG